jgi:hypothetical protein
MHRLRADSTNGSRSVLAQATKDQNRDDADVQNAEEQPPADESHLTAAND